MFYRLMDLRLRGKSTIRALIVSDGNIARSDKNKLELFAHVFECTFIGSSSLGYSGQTVIESNFSRVHDSMWFQKKESWK